MGADIPIVILRLLGACICAFLLYRAVRPNSRAYALPTLVAASLLAWFFASSSRPDRFWTWFFMYFVGTAAMFGIHAHAIKWLVGRSGRSGTTSEMPKGAERPDKTL